MGTNRKQISEIVMGAKLGLKITKSFSGFGTGFGVNESIEWTKNIRDTRDDYKCIPALEDDSNASVIMYSASEVGEFFTIISSIAARPGDFVSAWIYLPNNVQIGERDLASVIDETRKQILADEIDTANLESIFGKEYSEWEIPKGCTKTNGLAYAVRYYGKGTDYQLWELLNLLSQPENANYKAIFLVDKGSGITPINCKDITGHILRDTFRVEPPASVDGFEPFYNGVKFTRPQRVTEGEKMVVVWQKKNYADITTTSIITSENCRIQTINPSQYQKYISHNDIRVFGEKGNLIPDEKYTLNVNGRILERGMRVPVSVAILKEVSISVTGCKGFKDVRTNCDFTLNSPCSITLKEECFKYEFAMPLRPEIGNSARVSTIIDESRYKLDRTPFEGYRSYDGYIPSQTRENRIIYQPDKKPLWKRLILPGLSLILGIIIGIGIMDSITESSKKKSDNNELERYQEIIKDKEQEIERLERALSKRERKVDAVSILQKEVWVKQEFNEVPELKGLWDKLNNYEFDAILQYDKFDNSPKFVELKESIRNFTSAGGTKANFGEKWCTNGEISIDTYINKLKDKTNKLRSSSTSSRNTTGPSADDIRNAQLNGQI